MDQFKKKLVVVLAFTFLFAGEVNANPAGSGKDAPAIIADVFICRPLGLMALTGGSAFVCADPAIHRARQGQGGC